MAIQTLKAVSNRVCGQTGGKAKRLALACWIFSQGTPGITIAVELSSVASPQEIFRARVFEEPLVPVGGEPTPAENAALAVALQAYSNRKGPDDFSAITGFLEKHPRSVWNAVLLTGLGLEYYKSAYYSLALEAWREAWALGQQANNLQGKFLADRAVCELAGLYSRLGRIDELEALLKSVEQRVFLGGATERISLAREALWMMKYQPGVSFRCGPLALQSIKRSLNPSEPGDMAIFNSASTQQGFSLPQVAELSKKIGLNYQMARREKTGEFVIPSVVHWKVGHYAALVRQVGDQYLLEDPTFGNTVWATKRALEAETSGYFLIPGELPPGWRSVDAKEGGTIWGKGVTSGNDPDNYTPDDLQTGSCGGIGMAVSGAHLMLANLQVRDTPVGYTPPVGTPVRFTLRYNHRDYLQQPSLISSIFGPKWTHDWSGSISDDPNRPLADVKYYVGGGGARTFTGFDPNTQTFAPQQYDQTQLRRIGTNVFTSTYEMLYPDGSKKIFGLRGADKLVFLTQVVDPAGNAVTLTWEDTFLGYRLAALTDAIGQVTTISYGHSSGHPLITQVTDPFGRSATFEYTSFLGVQCGTDPNNGSPIYCPVYILSKITDVVGLVSKFEYTLDFMRRMITPYGTNIFTYGNGPQTNLTMRFLETVYPDGSRDRVEFNQSEHLGIANSEPAASVPQGMSTLNSFLYARNTFYWNRVACATAYGDYTKARIYHWLHTPNISITSGILESTKQALERRVWYDYVGQPGPYGVGTTDKPRHGGRVLDDGTTQLYTYEYSRFGHVTNSVDPVGRRFSFIYDTNGIDLVESRQTRAGNNELLFKATYNAQHRPLTTLDAAGRTNTYTYNARGQLLTQTNPKNEITTYRYDPNGYLTSIDGPLEGTSDLITYTYDSFGRVRTTTGVSGYTLFFNYDALDRLVRVTHPDSTFTQYTYVRLDLVHARHRNGQATLLEYDDVGQLTKETDPLGRVTLFSWCRCGSLKSLIDPMGRTTEWHTDVQGRLIGKQYGDGSQISYIYEDTTSRLRQVTDEKQQATHYTYNRDDNLKSVSYVNAVIPTRGVTYGYDTNYPRVISMTDGTGTTLYSYYPITGAPSPGGGQLATVDGPLPNDTITYSYDELGRRITAAINGVAATIAYDALSRVTGETNALGSFAYGYDGPSRRQASVAFPNNQTEERGYFNNLQDRLLQRITHRVNLTPVSEFIYDYDVPAGRIANWSQQIEAQTPNLQTFGYDAANQLLSAIVTDGGAPPTAFTYTYDLAGNRLSEQVGNSNYIASYNALNQISTSTGRGVVRTNEWDAQGRLIAVTSGSERTEFTYDGYGRRVRIRQLVNGSEVSHRRFVWCDDEICEERDATGAVLKRYFPHGVKVENGPVTGTFYYTRDHLSSIRELTDNQGNVRARYTYDPYGRRTKVAGDVDADFGFAGMFWSPEANLSLTLYRAYDPEVGRWLSRDPLKNAEVTEGPNLYAYVANDPVNRRDPLGLAWDLDFLAKHKGRLPAGPYHKLVEAFKRAHPDVVIPEHLKPDPTFANPMSPNRPRPLKVTKEVASAGGEIVEAGGEIAEVRNLNRLPRPTPAPFSPGLSGVAGAFVDMGMTVLTMANCDVGQGIFALMRVRRGELANRYENEMMKELEKELW